MSPLEQLRAAQHNDLLLPSDHALTAYLSEVSARTARRDLAPVTEIERRHLHRARRTTR